MCLCVFFLFFFCLFCGGGGGDGKTVLTLCVCVCVVCVCVFFPAQETDSLGDTSTLADPSVVDVLIGKANAAIEAKTGKAAAAAAATKS